MRNKKLLYASLASVTTVAVSNSIYQSTKTSIARRQQVKQGEVCAAEAKSFKNKTIMLDVLSVGVAAIGIKNAANGWKKLERVRQEDKRRK